MSDLDIMFSKSGILSNKSQVVFSIWDIIISISDVAFINWMLYLAYEMLYFIKWTLHLVNWTLYFLHISDVVFHFMYFYSSALLSINILMSQTAPHTLDSLDIATAFNYTR